MGVDLPVIGGHAKGFNTSTAGIALLGQHHPGASPASARPSEAAAAAVESLAAWKLGLHGVDPLGSTWLKNRSSSGAQKLSSEHWHLVPTVLAHRDIGLTSCPGDHGVDVTRSLPDHLSAGHPGSLPYQFDGWTPADIGSGFVTVDGRGGLRPSGSAALAGIGQPAANNSSPLAVPSPPPVAVAAVRTGAQASGYVLHSDGVVHAFGTSPGNAGRPAGESVAVDVAMAAVGGWVISADGVVHGFGGAQNLQVGGSNTSPVVAGAVDASGRGYLLGSDGRLRPVGAAPERQANAQGIANVVDVTVRPGGSSGWVLTAEGDLIAFGGAPEVEITASRVPSSARRYRALVASESGAGGWLLTDDGQLWPFGNERLIPGVSTTVVTGDAIDVALVSPVVDAEFVASSTGLYLDAVVEVFLDRPATAADYGHWEGRLRYQGGRQTVTLGLARSEEWAGLRIDAMYRDVLGRSPDESGRSYWLAQMAAGLALERVGVYFYGSDEYVADAGSADTYVTRLYRVLLGREPDQAGLNYWRGELQSGRATPADVASGFYASVESRRDRVSALYREVLDRPPDSNGLGYWAQRLLETDDVVLAAELAASDEFHARAIG